MKATGTMKGAITITIIIFTPMAGAVPWLEPGPTHPDAKCGASTVSPTSLRDPEPSSSGS